MLILFWIAVAVVLYVYFGYPLLLWLGASGWRSSLSLGSRDDCSDTLPTISILVAAHDEEIAIAGKLRDLLAIDYPRASFEILVGDDGSSDRTAAIVRSVLTQGVQLISSGVQQGKSSMQNRLAAASSGEILVFTDADCLVPSDALKSLVQHFSDPRVGLVTARPYFINERETGIVANESLYLRYETWLRTQESARGILAMASGSLFAMRRSLWRPLDPAHGDDFVLPLRVLQSGMRNVLDARVAAITRLSQNRPLAMLRMKTRIISKDFRALLAHRSLLNPLHHGVPALALLSHKLLRWLVPYLLLTIVTCNVFLLGSRPFRTFAIAQALFYAAAFVGLACDGRRAPLVCTLPMSFCLVNLAALRGTLHCCFGGTFKHWKPERSVPSTISMTATPVSSSSRDSQ